jgi:hypothetical protein
MSEETKRDERVVNLSPFHSEVKATSSGFDWTFFGSTANGNRHRIVLHCEFWWVGFIARDMWKVVASRKRDIEAAEKALKEAA